MVSLTKLQVVILFGVILLVVFAGYSQWQHFYQPQPVTGKSQQLAETTDG